MVIPGNGGYAQHWRSPMVLLIIRERFRHIFFDGEIQQGELIASDNDVCQRARSKSKPR